MGLALVHNANTGSTKNDQVRWKQTGLHRRLGLNSLIRIHQMMKEFKHWYKRGGEVNSQQLACFAFSLQAVERKGMEGKFKNSNDILLVNQRISAQVFTVAGPQTIVVLQCHQCRSNSPDSHKKTS